MDLDLYRSSAEEFIAELDLEYYRHYAGLKDEYELDPIYERHATLFSRRAIDWLRSSVADSTPGTEQHASRRMLLDFAVEGHLGRVTKRLEEEIARREASIATTLDGQRIGFRQAAVVQANEPAAERRAALERGTLALLEDELGPLYRESLELVHDAALGLGYPSYRALCEACKAIDLDTLHAQTHAFAQRTAAAYPAVLGPELDRTLGLAPSELRRSDLPRLFRAARLDQSFASERLLPSFVETMRALGIDVRAQRGLVLDVAPRPNKSPRAFCAAVRRPGEVYLVLAPVGGFEDYETLFHEGGHAEHAAHADPELPFEFRHLGDAAISEGYAFLFQYLIEDPEWLRRHLGVSDAETIRSHARAQRLIYLRRYAAKLAYELELHGRPDGDPATLADRYAELLSEALAIPWPHEPFLADLDPGFYCAAYLRAWALERQLRRYLRERFGIAWFEEPAAGEVLRELWRRGERANAEELVAELTGESLDFAALADEFVTC